MLRPRPSARPTAPMLRWGGPVVALGVGLGLVLALIGGPWHGALGVSADDAALADDLIPIPIAVAAMTLARQARLRTVATVRTGWEWLLGSVGLWITAQLTWTAIDVPTSVDPITSPTAADALYVAAVVTGAVCLAHLPGVRATWGDLADAAILALSGVSIVLALHPAPLMVPGGPLGPSVASIGYLVGDVILIALAWVGVRRGGGLRPTMYRLTAATSAFAAALIGTAEARTSAHPWVPGLVGLCWAAGFLMVALAALQPFDRHTPAVDDDGPFTLPYAVTALAVAVTVLQWLLTSDPVAGPVVLLLGAAVLALARQQLTMRDNQVLVRLVAANRDDLFRQSQFDPVTGQGNRALFTKRLTASLERSRDDSAVAVLLCDLDAFRSLNDSLGHARGDHLLAQVGWRMRAALPPTATLARLTADEFAVLLEHLPPATVECVAQRVALTLKTALATPFEIGGVAVNVTVAVGVATAACRPAPASPGADELLSRAGMALHLAKQGQDPFRPVVYSDGLELPEAHDWQLRPALELALREGQIIAHYQSVVGLGSGTVHAVEALARWDRPDVTGSNFELPALFLPVMQRAGLLPRLTEHMLRTATRQLAAHRVGDPDARVRVTVNVSPRQIVDPTFPDLVARVLTDAGLPPDALVLEITEESLLEGSATAVVVALGSLGVQLWLDDFGVGYSSLSVLHQLPLSAVKLDKCLTRTIDTDPGLRRLVGGMLALTSDLGLSMVAEGVQRPEQLRVLQDLGCPFGQGFLFGPPTLLPRGGVVQGPWWPGPPAATRAPQLRLPSARTPRGT